MSYSVSMRDIALAAGVSKAAVSRVINGRPAGIRVSPTTRDRVLAIVRQNGYQADRFARQAALRSQPTLGLVLASGGLDASAGNLPAVETVLAANGVRLQLIVLPTNPAAAPDRVKRLLNDGVAGFLCAPAAMPAVIQVVAGTKPVVPLGPAAGEMILVALGMKVAGVAGSMEQGAPSAPSSPVVPGPAAPRPTPTPIIVPVARVPITPPLRASAPEPAMPARVIPVTPTPTPAVIKPTPVIPSQPAPLARQEPAPSPDPEPLSPEPIPEQDPTPVAEPAVVEPPPEIPAEPIPTRAPRTTTDAAPSTGIRRPSSPATASSPARGSIASPHRAHADSAPTAKPDPVVELPVDKSEEPESQGEGTVPEEDGTAQPELSPPPESHSGLDGRVARISEIVR